MMALSRETMVGRALRRYLRGLQTVMVGRAEVSRILYSRAGLAITTAGHRNGDDALIATLTYETTCE